MQEVLREEEARDPSERMSLLSDPLIMAEFRALAQGFRRSCTSITNQLKQPVPFPYYHVLNLFMCVGGDRPATSSVRARCGDQGGVQ